MDWKFECLYYKQGLLYQLSTFSLSFLNNLLKLSLVSLQSFIFLQIDMIFSVLYCSVISDYTLIEC